MHEQIDTLIKTLRLMQREQKALMNASAKSADFWGASARQHANAAEKATLIAVELRRLKHEAHCLAVEVGIADRRADGAYEAGAASLGFGREVRIEKRAPASAGSEA